MKNLNLISARKNKKITQEELAVMLGCKKSSVSNWENGYANPRLSLAVKVAHILEKDVVDLFSNPKQKGKERPKVIQESKIKYLDVGYK